MADDKNCYGIASIAGLVGQRDGIGKAAIGALPSLKFGSTPNTPGVTQTHDEGLVYLIEGRRYISARLASDHLARLEREGLLSRQGRRFIIPAVPVGSNDDT